MKNTRIGHKIAKYYILAEIGQGGMSIVYQARDQRLNREVALKILHPFLAKNLESQKRLAREAQIAARLQHPNIVQVFDYSELSDSSDSAELFIVSELVKGTTLKEFATKHNLKETPELGAFIVWQIAQALQHAHSQGVVHRDIKPENIMIRNDGVVKIMDFGMARIKKLDSLTVTGALLGSPAHMAPETIEGKGWDHRADLFSLTTVLYWLTTGELPFFGETAHALLKAIVDGRYKPPQEASEKISPRLNQIILKGLATNPEERFSSAESMAEELLHMLLDFQVDCSSNELKQILASPQTQIPLFKKNLLENCLSEFEQQKKESKTAQAMVFLSRLLAENPEDPQTQQLLWQYENKTFRLRWRFLISISLVGCLFVLSFIKTDKLASKSRIPPLLGQSVVPNYVPVPALPSKRKQTKKIAETLPLMIPVSVLIEPYADFYINGKLFKNNASQAHFKLKPGIYHFAFKHRFAVSEERIVPILKRDKKKILHIALVKSKPALLIIKSNKNADIAINGIYKGSTLGSLSRPILIPVPDKTHAIKADIVISSPGYKTLVLNQRLVAGQKKALIVKLEEKTAPTSKTL